MLKKVNNPKHFRLGYRYNEAVDKYELYHALYIQQLQKTAELQDEIDELYNLCAYYKHGDKSLKHFRTGL